MDNSKILSGLKIDLGIMTTAYDERLKAYISHAMREIERESVTLDLESIADQELVIQYASWMWRKRETGEGMPRMIRWQLNNRIFDRTGDSE